MEQFKQYLKEDESLLWSGQPDKIEALDAQYKSIILKKVIIAIVVTAALCVGYGVISAGRADTKAGLYVIIAIIGAYVAYSPFADAASLQKKFFYAITDQRILILRDKCKEVPYSSVKKAKFVTDAAGMTSLLINDAVEAGQNGNIRSLAVTCTNKDGEEFENNAVLYAIPDAAAVKAILGDYIPFS